MKILNLTQHPATPEQKAAGVYDAKPGAQSRIRELLTFNHIPVARDMNYRAKQLINIAHEEEANAVMIGGAPWFMPHLQHLLAFESIRTLYAFSRRESIEEQGEDGSITKRSVFRHIGFYEA